MVRGEYTLPPLLAYILTMDVLPVAVYVAPGYMPAAWQDVLCYVGGMMLQRAPRYGISVYFPADRHPDLILY